MLLNLVFPLPFPPQRILQSPLLLEYDDDDDDDDNRDLLELKQLELDKMPHSPFKSLADLPVPIGLPRVRVGLQPIFDRRKDEGAQEQAPTPNSTPLSTPERVASPTLPTFTSTASWRESRQQSSPFCNNSSRETRVETTPSSCSTLPRHSTSSGWARRTPSPLRGVTSNDTQAQSKSQQQQPPTPTTPTMTGTPPQLSSPALSLASALLEPSASKNAHTTKKMIRGFAFMPLLPASDSPVSSAPPAPLLPTPPPSEASETDVDHDHDHDDDTASVTTDDSYNASQSHHHHHHHDSDSDNHKEPILGLESMSISPSGTKTSDDNNNNNDGDNDQDDRGLIPVKPVDLADRASSHPDDPGDHHSHSHGDDDADDDDDDIRAAVPSSSSSSSMTTPPKSLIPAINVTSPIHSMISTSTSISHHTPSSIESSPSSPLTLTPPRTSSPSLPSTFAAGSSCGPFSALDTIYSNAPVVHSMDTIA